MVEAIPLECPYCRALASRPISWVQEHARFLCSCCGANVLIDKDRVALWLLRREGREAPEDLPALLKPDFLNTASSDGGRGGVPGAG